MVGRAEESSWPYLLKLALASVPAAIVGLAFKDWFEARFDDPGFTGTMLLVTGMVVWSSRWTRAESLPDWEEFVPLVLAAVAAFVLGSFGAFLVVSAILLVILGISRATSKRDWKAEPTWAGALVMGIAQACAILPGISRSGSTVLTGLWRRIDPVAAAEFSFLMSIPAIIGAAVLALPDLAQNGGDVGAFPLAAGFIAAGVAGVLAIRWFVALLANQNFHVFAYYCWIAGTLFLLTL